MMESSLFSTSPKSFMYRFRCQRLAFGSCIVLFILLFLSILYPEFSSMKYDQTNLSLGSIAPSRDHWMGTDSLGRDLMARIFLGGRISFSVGVIATTLSILIGVTWGGVAGYLGGKWDVLLMRMVDILYTLPFLVIVILVMVFFGSDRTILFHSWMKIISIFVKRPDDPNFFAVYQIILVFIALGGISWLTMARIVRGQVLSIKNQPFVEAARCLGYGHSRILFRHILPNSLGPILVYGTLTVPEVMLTEAFLSFLGLGTQEPLASWGTLSALGVESMGMYPWQILFPASILTITLLCFNFVGEGLRAAMDPKSHRGFHA